MTETIPSSITSWVPGESNERAKRRVVLTGALGFVAGRMIPVLRDRFDLALLDVRPAPLASGLDVLEADLTDQDRDRYREYFRGASAVIHCAYIPGEARTRDEQFNVELANLRMVFNVLQTSAEEGVQRVVFASSNHASDHYESLIWEDRLDFVTTEARSLSDNLYGWAKTASEKLGFVFACGGPNPRQIENIGPHFAYQVTRPLANIHIRIGSPSDTAVPDSPLGDLKRLHRGLGAYLSARDQAQLFVKSVEAPDIRDEYGIPFQIFFGISGNSDRFWNIANARRVVGYAPQDDSRVRFADEIARHVAVAEAP